MPPRRPKPPGPTHDALYRAVRAAPCDDLPRLVLADYLDEHGDPDRAAAIRLQCRLAGMNEWDDGYTETMLDAENVIRRNLKEWTADVPGWSGVRDRYWARGESSAGFTGGFPGSLDIDLGRVTDDVIAGLVTLPVSRVTLRDGTGGEPDRLLRTAALFPLARLKVVTEHPATAAALAAARPAGLSGLEFSLYGEETAAEAVRGVRFTPLEDLFAFLPTAAAVAGLARRPRPAGLRFLRVHGALTPAAAGRLAAAGWVAGLSRLDLVDRNAGRPSALGPLLRADGLGGLRALSLYPTDAGRAVSAVAGATGLGPLDTFDLHTWRPDVGLTPTAVDVLVQAPALSRVKRVMVRPPLADPDGGLAAVGRMPGLRVLHMRPPGATYAGVAALARSPAAGTLCRLELADLSLTFAAGSGLAAGPGWPELAALTFTKDLTDSDGGAVAALVDSPKFPRLTSLDVSGTSGAADLWRRLAASDAVARFRRLRLAFPVTDAELNALLDSPAVRAVGHLALPVRRGVTAKTRRRFEQIYGVPLTRDS